ncbi:MAG: hypothetical protein JRE40_15375 [Deltaproteobacteria bacterium]|nr:hypothetical protein [Deltaproteobacteria bacterium]
MKRKLKSNSKMLITSRLEKLRCEIKDLEQRILESVQMDNWSVEPRILRPEAEACGGAPKLEAS